MNDLKYKSLPEAFLVRCDEIPEFPALQYKSQNQWKMLTFKEFKEKVIALSGFLLQLHFGSDQRIALLSNNRPEWVISDLAIMMIQSATIPLYPTLQQAQIDYILKEAECSALILEDKNQLEKIRNKIPEMPFLKSIIVIDPVGVDLTPNIVSFNEAIQYGLKLDQKQREMIVTSTSRIMPNDLASIVYTSGTTGVPKGVMLSHGNFIQNAASVLERYKASPEDTVLSLLPLSHVLEKTAGFVTCNIMRGARYVFAESIEKVGENLVEVAPTIMVAVPRLFEKMYSRIMNSVHSGSNFKKQLFNWAIATGQKYQRSLRKNKISFITQYQFRLAEALVFRKIHARTGGRLRLTISGGAPLEPKIAEFFQSINLPILEGYGLTETSPVISANPPEWCKIGSVGPVLNRVEVKIAPDGEILVKGPIVMKGYYRNPEATSEVFTEDGWLKTGDIGKLDQDGYLFITDRKKEMMVTSGGKNIAPQPIENLLKSHPMINQIILIGDKRNFISALIIPAFDELQKWADEKGLKNLSNQSLIEQPAVIQYYENEIGRLTAHLPKFEQVKKVALIAKEWSIESGELTPTMKLKRQVIYDRNRQLIESLYLRSGDSDGFR